MLEKNPRLATLQEYHTHARSEQKYDEDEARLDRIEIEFRRAFEFLEKLPKSVSFFGSSVAAEQSRDYIQARELAARFVREKEMAVVTGGGPGIMAAANQGAAEAKGVSVGLTIDLNSGEGHNNFYNTGLPFHYFFARKMALSFAASMYIFFPGGFGTLDEFFELITLVQTKKIERIPIFCIGQDYWQPLERFMHYFMLERGAMITESHLGLFTITDDLDLVLECASTCRVRH